jgi:hypothetical protein
MSTEKICLTEYFFCSIVSEYDKAKFRLHPRRDEDAGQDQAPARAYAGKGEQHYSYPMGITGSD